MAQSLLFASITRFEFIEDPNGGNSEVKDPQGKFGPKVLKSFKYTVQATPADIRFMNQNDATAMFSVDSVTGFDPNQGIDTGQDIPLFEGITWLYPYARNPVGNAGGAPWILGPISFSSQADLLFKVDQGPPKAPQIVSFTVDGARPNPYGPTPIPSAKAFFVNQTPANADVLLEVFFNKFDVDNAPGSKLEVAVAGRVENDPGKFDADPNAQPNPNPVTTEVRPESNANVAAQLDRILSGIPISGPPELVEFLKDTTTFSGPGPLSVSLVNVAAGQSQPNIAPGKTGQALGEFEPLGFDFKTIPDGDYEIILGARDAVGNLSPGGFNAFSTLSNPTSGVPARIIIKKDTISPQSVILEKPKSVFIFGNVPPSVDPPFEDPIFIIKGSVSNERQEAAKIHIYTQDSPDLDGNPATGPIVNKVTLTDPNSGVFQELVDAANFNPQIPTSGQTAYRFLFVPEDNLGNVNLTDIAELFVIKDYVNPPSPVFTNLALGDAITSKLFTIKGEAANPVNSLNAEHGLMQYVLEIFQITSSGLVGIQTQAIPASTGASSPLTSSLLDDGFIAAAQTLAITDPRGFVTGESFSIPFSDRTTRYANLIYPTFFFSQLVNFENIPDGLLRLNLCLLDQVGNKSNPCTSIDVLKDLTGPKINLSLQDSGPDDNYTTNFPTLPNFLGADDRKFLISLKSPEFTVDGGTGPVASVPDPVFQIPGMPPLPGRALLLKGSSSDDFGFTSSIQITGSKIPSVTLQNVVSAPAGTDLIVDFGGVPFQVSQPPFPKGATITFEARVPVFNLADNVPETIRIRALDNLGNLGPFSDLSVVRDVTVPKGPQIQVPPILPGFVKPTLYTNLDKMDIRGVTEPNARLVLLLPPANSLPGFPIPAVDRIPLTTPGSIPIAGSDFDTLAPVCGRLVCVPLKADPDGVFNVTGIDISTIATSLSTATTIYIQTIDAMDNTDPVTSVSEIEVHRNTLNVPLDRLFVLDYPKNTQQNVLIFPDSTASTPGRTVFFTRENVKFRLEVLFPMVEAPDLAFRQPGSVFRPASKISSTFPQTLGTFVFQYVYEVLPEELVNDGVVDFKVSGGKDLFGNASAVTTGSFAFIVDTVAPNKYSTAPTLITSPKDSVLLTEFTSTRMDLTDFFKDTASVQFASGLATGSLSIRLFGPLQETPDSLNEIPLTTFLPLESGFDLAASPNTPLPTDGTYRLEYLAIDRVGNRNKYFKTFLLDREAIVTPLLFTNPSDQSFVNTMPGFPPSISLKIQDIEADLDRSSLQLIGPGNQILSGIKSIIPTQSSIIQTLLPTSVPLSDGSSDGRYRILMDVFDLTGNRTIKEHSFILDTVRPTARVTYPEPFTCVSSLSLAQIAVQDVLLAGIPNSGMDRSRSQIALRLQTPVLPWNTSLPQTLIPGPVTYLSEGSGPESTLILMSKIEAGQLPKNGTFDGTYSIEAGFSDQASNRNTAFTTFFFDSLKPSVYVQDLADLSFLTNRNYRFTGQISDRGCGFSKGVTGLNTQVLRLDIYAYDLDTGAVGQKLDGPVFPQILNQASIPNYAVESVQASFVLSGIFPQGFNQALFEFTALDQGGNSGSIQRVLKLSSLLPPLPRRLSPLSTSIYRSKVVSTFTTSPVLNLSWEPVVEANRYRLHLTRQSLTPGLRTTFVDLDKGTLARSVDYNLVLSSPSSLRLSTSETLYWFVESLDGLGQPSDPQAAFGLGERIELDRQVDSIGMNHLKLVIKNTELDPSAIRSFATGSEIRFRLYAPEVLRLSGSEIIYFTLGTGDTKFHLPGVESLPVETSILEFAFPMPEGLINGSAALYLQNLKDRAGNVFNIPALPFKIDKGPEFSLRMFQNPIDPLVFHFVFKGSDYDGKDDLLYVNPGITPRVYFSQAGITPTTEISLTPVHPALVQNQLYAFGFTGLFKVDPELIGDVVLKIYARDINDHEVVRNLDLHVASPARRKTSLSLGSLDRSGFRFTPFSADRGRVIYSSRRLQMSTGNREDLLQDWPLIWYADGVNAYEIQGQQKVEDCRGIVLLRRDADQISALDREQWNCASGSVNVSMLTSSLNQIELIRDLVPPQITLPAFENLTRGAREICIQSQDRESLVSSVIFRLGDASIDAVEKRGEFCARMNLDSGPNQLEFESRDLAGNAGRAMAVAVAAAEFGLHRCEVAPNPVRHQGYLNCVFGQTPEQLQISLYASNGRRIRQIQAPLASEIKEFLALDGLANGVYFLKLRAFAGGREVKKTIKFALIR